MKRYLALAAVMAALATPAAAQMAPGAAAAAPMMLTPHTYRMMAAISDSFEIQSAQLALERSRDPAVRRFANMMVRDHSMTTQALRGACRWRPSAAWSRRSTSVMRPC